MPPVDAEVIREKPAFSIPLTRIDLGTTLQSPFFWIVIGMVSGVVLMYYIDRRK